MYYELAVASLSEDESHIAYVDETGELITGRRSSTDDSVITFSDNMRAAMGMAANDPRLTVVANTLPEWQVYVNTPGSKYTPFPTAEQLEQQRQSEVQQMRQRIDQAVERSTDKYMKKLRGQEARYGVKLEDAQHGIETGEFRRTVTAALTRWNADHPGQQTDELGICQILIAMREQYHHVARAQEAAREEGYAAAVSEDVDGVQAAIDEIDGL